MRSAHKYVLYGRVNIGIRSALMHSMDNEAKEGSSNYLARLAFTSAWMVAHLLINVSNDSASSNSRPSSVMR